MAAQGFRGAALLLGGVRAAAARPGLQVARFFAAEAGSNEEKMKTLLTKSLNASFVEVVDISGKQIGCFDHGDLIPAVILQVDVALCIRSRWSHPSSAV